MSKRSGRWFRFYEESLHDPKVQRLAGDLFKTWVNLLCVASQNDGYLPDNPALTLLLRRRSDHLKRDVNTLVNCGLLDETDRGLTPHNWFVRQYKSDVSTPRVNKHRQGKRNVTSAVSETAPETETETEKKKEPFSQERKRPEAGRDLFGKEPPPPKPETPEARFFREFVDYYGQTKRSIAAELFRFADRNADVAMGHFYRSKAMHDGVAWLRGLMKPKPTIKADLGGGVTVDENGITWRPMHPFVPRHA